MTYPCPTCGAPNQTVNQCGCDPGKLPMPARIGNARFWAWWNGGCVKITLRPGEQILLTLAAGAASRVHRFDFDGLAVGFRVFAYDEENGAYRIDAVCPSRTWVETSRSRAGRHSRSGGRTRGVSSLTEPHPRPERTRPMSKMTKSEKFAPRSAAALKAWATRAMTAAKTPTPARETAYREARAPVKPARLGFRSAAWAGLGSWTCAS